MTSLRAILYIFRVGGWARQVEQVINSLISLLQDSVRMGENRVFTQLGTELTITRYYCDIQSIVYPDAFTLETQIDPQALTLSVPKTILQPLVENAIVHGLLPSLRRGRVVVRRARGRARPSRFPCRLGGEGQGCGRGSMLMGGGKASSDIT